MRTEKDGIGDREIEPDDLRGIHTHRALANFPVGLGRPLPEQIHALFQVKLACLNTNRKLGHLTPEIGDPCRKAIKEGLTGTLNDRFTITMYQGGAGTSFNMNMNEVIANRALQLAGHKAGQYEYIHPLLHVNLHQSTNDVIPTAGRVAGIALAGRLENAVLALQERFQEKEKELDDFVKPGRTQLQDAVPVTLGREFSAYAGALARDRWRIYKIVERLREVNLGGTAVGTGMMAPRNYIFQVVDELKRVTGFPLARAENLMDATQNTDVLVESHGFLAALSASLIKISGDLRLMASGPEAGLAEIILEPVQAGSSIMPGKFNPVIPEYVTSACLRVQSNQQLLGSAASMGSLELNPFVPIMNHTILESMKLLESGCLAMAACISGIQPNTATISAYQQTDVLVTYALAARLGYERAQEIYLSARESDCTVRTYVLENHILTEDELGLLLSPENLLKLGF